MVTASMANTENTVGMHMAKDVMAITESMVSMEPKKVMNIQKNK